MAIWFEHCFLYEQMYIKAAAIQIRCIVFYPFFTPLEGFSRAWEANRKLQKLSPFEKKEEKYENVSEHLLGMLMLSV